MINLSIKLFATLIALAVTAHAGEVFKFTPATLSEDEFDEILCSAVISQVKPKPRAELIMGHLALNKGRPVLITLGPNNQNQSHIKQDYWFWYPITNDGLGELEQGHFHDHDFEALAENSKLFIDFKTSAIAAKKIDALHLQIGLYQYERNLILIINADNPRLVFNESTGALTNLKAKLTYLNIEPDGAVDHNLQKLDLDLNDIENKLRPIWGAQFSITNQNLK